VEGSVSNMQFAVLLPLLLMPHINDKDHSESALSASVPSLRNCWTLLLLLLLLLLFSQLQIRKNPTTRHSSYFRGITTLKPDTLLMSRHRSPSMTQTTTHAFCHNSAG